MRYLSIQIPDFSLVRMNLASRRQGRPWPPEGAAAGLIRQQANAPRLVAVNPQAAALGLRPGLVLADARAILPSLLVRDAEPERDAKAMAALAEWCLRYSPQVALDGCPLTPFALMLEITGCAHLFGGEAAMLADIRARLKRWGFRVQAAIADSQAKAWAFARFGANERVADLPMAALRLDPELVSSLRRLGLERVGHLMDMPRRALLQRFSAVLLERLEALSGRRIEPFVPWRETPLFTARLGWPEPIGVTAAIEAACGELCRTIARELDRSRRGARRLRLVLGRIDGALHPIELRLGRPQRDPMHMTRLLAMRLDGLDIGFGIEFMALEVTDSAELDAFQTDLVNGQDHAALMQLTDQLRQRLGEGRVMRLQPIASHIPERAQAAIPAEAELDCRPWPSARPRPLRLLPNPERLRALAEVPDGPPLRIDGGRIDGGRIGGGRIEEAIGPERIEAEWWRLGETMRARDYWQVRDECGAMHWLYREGRYGDALPPQWFRHGRFQ